MTDILRKSSFERLIRGLDAAVDAATHLEVVKDAILLPLMQLRALSTEVEGVFAEDPRAVERLTLMLSSHASAAVRSTAASSPEPQDPREQPGTDCRPGIIHLGRLVLLGLAAGRVGEHRGDRRAFVETVFGLASLALPAEQIEAMTAAGLAPAQLRTLLEGMHAEDSGVALSYAQVRTFLDQGSQARRACLLAYEQAVIEDAQGWSSSTSAPIVGVRRSKTKGGDKLVVSLADPGACGDDAELTVTPKDIENGVAAVVLASPQTPPLTVALSPKCLTKKNTVTLTLPPEARAGWIGLTSAPLRQAALRRRSEVRDSWEQRNHDTCLRYTPVELDVIVPRDADPDELPVSIPPSSADARWGVRILDVAVGDRADGVADGSTSVTAWLGSSEESPKAMVEIDGESHSMSIRDGVGTTAIPTSHLVDGARLMVSAFGGGREQPDDVRQIELEPPRHGTPSPHPKRLIQRYVLLRPRITIPSDDETGAPSTRRVGLDEVESRRDELEKLRPSWIETELPWVDGEFLGLPRPILDAHDRTANWLLQQMEHLAARCPGFEDAIWIAIVPRSARTPSFLRSAPTSSCAGLVIATPESLTPDDLPLPSRIGVERRRARLVGRIDKGGPILTDPIRFEHRPAGEGAEHLTEFVAVALDRDGAERGARRIATVSPSRSGSFTCLLPADDDVTSVAIVHRPHALAVEVSSAPSTVYVDLRGVGRSCDGDSTERRTANEGRALPRISRIGEGPVIEELRLDGDVLRWRYHHPIGYGSHFSIEAGSSDGRGWAPVASLSGGYARMHVDLSQLAPGTSLERIRVVASDGWNSTTAELEHPPGDVVVTAGRSGMSHVSSMRIGTPVEGK